MADGWETLMILCVTNVMFMMYDMYIHYEIYEMYNISKKINYFSMYLATNMRDSMLILFEKHFCW